ncbi:MAG: radical SAM protein [Deltaproteobacteria bacterium]|nr:radical SAM protein [Deltaproteobacteria bacterium]
MKKTVSFSKKASNIFFHILTDCNLKCAHCYINKKEHGQGKLPVETIKLWLSVFAKRNPKKKNLIFLGGEPTLHPDLSEAVKEAKRLNYESITVDTNGYLFFDILSKVTPEQVDYFSFSIDGSNTKLNDKIRGKGSYEKVIEGIKKAKAKGFKTSMIYTVSSYNIEDIKNMPDILKDIMPDKFFIQIIGIRGKPAASANNFQVNNSQWFCAIPNTAKKIAELGISVIYPKVYLKKEEPFECAGLLADNYFIFPNGRVYKCPLCEDFAINGLYFNKNNKLVKNGKINEDDLFNLSIPEGCVINKIVQSDNIEYNKDGKPLYKIACCMLKEEIS